MRSGTKEPIDYLSAPTCLHCRTYIIGMFFSRSLAEEGRQLLMRGNEGTQSFEAITRQELMENEASVPAVEQL